MNPTPQARQFAPGPRALHQQPFYTSRTGLAPSTGSRGVPPSSAPRAVTPTHVYQAGPGSQMMMIPQQQLSFPSSPQGPAYFIPGQYRSAAYMTTPQQYPVPAGTPGFYPGTSPAEYGTFGAFYPAQPQFPPPVQAGPVIMNPAPQQQQPPQPPQHISTKRERKQIRIRDPNRGGQDITEEIMSGGRTGSTPTPPQKFFFSFSPLVFKTDDRGKRTPPPLSNTPELHKRSPAPTEATSFDSNIKAPVALHLETPNSSLNTVSTFGLILPLSDTMAALPPQREPTPTPLPAPEVPAYPAPLPDPVPAPSIEKQIDETDVKRQEEDLKETEAEETQSSLDVHSAPPSGTNGVEEVEPEPLSVVLPAFSLEDSVESPIVQPEELCLPNGLPLPAPQDPEALAVNTAERDDSPIAEPEVSQTPPMQTSVTEAPPALTVQHIPVTTDLSASLSIAEESPVEADSQTLPAQPEDHDAAAEEPLDAQEDISFKKTVFCCLAAELMSCFFLLMYVAALSVPKKKRKMKDLNKKEAVGDLLDAFKESPPQSRPLPPPPKAQPLATSPAAPEEVDLTWEDKEDKLDAENIQPESPTSNDSDKKYQYKEEQWKPINMEDKKKYDRNFLLGFQFISASMNRPEGLPAISDVVLDKANKTPLRQLDPSRLPGMNCGPDFTPSFANLGRPGMGGGNRGPPPSMGIGVGGPRRSQQMQRKIFITMSSNEDVQLNKAEKAWKPSVKKVTPSRVAEDVDENDPENMKTQELFKRVRSILNKLTPQKFQQLMKQVTELTIDTEERLKGVIDLTFEKAISEPDFSVAYANMCRCLSGLKVQTTDKPGATANFRKLLLNRCQKEFEKDKDDDEIFEKKQKELDAASGGEEKQRLTEELEDAKDKARRRSLGNIKFIGELFKLKMLTEVIMHDCIVKLLKNHDEESLECLCRLLSTIGKDLDFEKAKPRMDQYFNQMDKIIKERKTTSRIRFMLQDVLDLRRNNWVPRRGDQGPKTIDQIHKEAELEMHREQMKVQQALISKKETPGGRMGGGGPGRGGPHTPGRGAPSQDEGWNTVPISKNRPIDTSRLSKITKTPVLDFNNQLLAPGGKGSWGSWGKGSSGGTSSKPADPESGSRPATSTLNRFSALQQASSNSGFSVDSELKRETTATPPPPQNTTEPALTEDELEKKSTAIIEEYLHINDMKEALQCVQEMTSPQLLFVFVRNGLESTLERSTIAREHMGLLLHQLLKTGILPTTQYYKGLQEILEVAEDMAIDIPHIFLYLAELITPMLQEGGIPMGELFRSIAKPLIPQGKAGLLLVHILTLLCKGMSHKKAGTLWREAGLRWTELLPEDVDINKFVTENNVEFTLGDESEKSEQKEMSAAELTKQLDRLIQDRADNQKIFDWVEANLDEQQTSSSLFVRVLMTCVCQSAIICENPYKVDSEQIKLRAKLLQRYLKDEQKELQALYALQALMVQMEQPANLLRMFFDILYDEDVIKEEAFYKWESSKDLAEQQGKGVALKSVTAFFMWLREAEDESDNS
uniref:Eukaryotic translation initiation factor 4 gamma 1 n=1 Tax=Oryzias sinensis TaxID=183150 RepID=A0A8C7Z3V9_9TELE